MTNTFFQTRQIKTYLVQCPRGHFRVLNEGKRKKHNGKKYIIKYTLKFLNTLKCIPQKLTEHS